MVAYNFNAQFEPKILAGVKRSTIRLPRKNGHAKVGDELQLYVGQRTPGCKLLMTAECVERWSIKFDGVSVEVAGDSDPFTLDCYQIAELSIAEGFDSIDDMLNWFSDPKYQGQWLEQIVWR